MKQYYLYIFLAFIVAALLLDYKNNSIIEEEEDHPKEPAKYEKVINIM